MSKKLDAWLWRVRLSQDAARRQQRGKDLSEHKPRTMSDSKKEENRLACRRRGARLTRLDRLP
jgi:hypothetical protein